MKLNLFKHMFAFTAALVLAAGSFASAGEDIKIVKINDSNFEKEILKSDKPVILDITSTSCPPCLVMIPTLIGIAKNYPDIKVATIGIDEPGIDMIKATLPIQAFPTFYMFKDGKAVGRLVGAVKEADLLRELDYHGKPVKQSKKKQVNKKKDLVCKVNGQFNGIKNLVTISFVFSDTEIKNVDIVTDGFIPPEMEGMRDQIISRMQSSGKGEVTPTMAGFRMHISNDCRFMKAMDMKRTSTYGEMRAGLELQGFTCQ